MRTISVQQRRRLLVRRHHLGGDADGPEDVTRAVVGLHASDPASVYLAVLARSSRTTVDEIAAAMYERRSLVRWLAMRRTLFVLPVKDVPIVQAAVSTSVAETLRRQLLARLERNGTEPPVHGDLDDWLSGLIQHVGQTLRTRGSATGTQLSADTPALRTVILARAPSDRPQALTSPLLTIMGAEGRIVRGMPTGAWTSRQHRWETVEHWWPTGLPTPSPDEARMVLARRWLARFGPAAAVVLQWWTGWNRSTVHRVLEHLPVDEVDLQGGTGFILRDDDLDDDRDDRRSPPVAALLPALDPTPMGWKQRGWLLGVDPRQVFDRAGNIGPTIWWDGEIVGSWAVTPAGDVRTKVVADRGREAERAAQGAAARLQKRLGGVVVTPAARTPLERSLAQS